MPNTLITQQVGPVCRQSLGLLHEMIVLPRLFAFDTSVDGSVAPGQTVNVRKPASFIADDFVRANGIQIQDVTEAYVPVALDKVWDVSVSLTSEELTYDLTSFGQQISLPAATALAEAAETFCAGLLAGSATSDVITAVANEPVEAVIDASKSLNDAQVPQGGRSLVVSTGVAAELKKSGVLLAVDSSGSSETLREATIGRLAGMTVYESSYIASPNAYAFGRDAAVFVSRAMTTMGAQAESASFEGISIRTVIDYDITKKSTVASWDVLAGGTVLDANRIVKIDGTALVTP